MLRHPTEERLLALGLTGMAKALEEQRRQPDICRTRLRGTLCRARRSRSDQARQLAAGNPAAVCEPEAERRRRRRRYQDTPQARPSAIPKLVAGEWVERRHNLLIIGPTGVGKSWITQAYSMR